MDFVDQIKVLLGTGPDSPTVYVPKKLITARSSYFRAACNDPRYEKHGFVRLPSSVRKGFAWYLQVLHYDNAITADEQSKTVSSVWLDLVLAYLSAESLGDPASMNIIMDALLKLANEGQELEKWKSIVTEVYTSSLAKAHPLKRLLVDYAVECSSLSSFGSAGFLSSSESIFITQVAKELAKKRDAGGKKSKKALESRAYHVEVKRA